MKINLIVKNNKRKNFKKIILYILFFVFLSCIVLNIFLKTNYFFKLKSEHKIYMQNSSSINNYKDKLENEKKKMTEINDRDLNWGMIFYDIYSKVPETIVITKLQMKDKIFLINGIANNKNQVFHFIEELKKLDICSEIYLDDLQNNSKLLYKIKFLLNY